MNKIKDLTGQKFGKLFVIKFIDTHKVYGSRWLCRCECGKITKIYNGNLKHAKSCGCYRIDASLPNRVNKVCSKCKQNKEIAMFNKNKSRSDGHSQFCKECTSKLDKEYRPSQREHRKQYSKNRRNSDIQFKIIDNCRRRINYALKRNSKVNHTLELLGCSVKQVKEHLQNKFDEEMTWNNYGKYWEIDHIKPCSLFDLSNSEQQLKCFNWKNLQPLEKIQNIKKGNKYYE